MDTGQIGEMIAPLTTIKYVILHIPVIQRIRNNSPQKESS